MAVRRPLVVANGGVAEMPPGDVLPADTASISSVAGLQDALNQKANITISSTAPVAPAVNDLWLEIV